MAPLLCAASIPHLPHGPSSLPTLGPLPQEMFRVPEHLLKHLWHHLSSEQNQSKSSYREEGRGLLPH